MPDVVDVVHQGGHSFEAETEGEPGIYLGVDADSLEHVRVDHAGASQLDPARALTRAAAITFIYSGAVADEAREIELCGRFGEGEVTRAETGFRVFTVHSL